MTKLQKNILLAMAGLLAVLLLAAGVAFATRQPPETVVGTFVPPEFDPNAQVGTPQVSNPAYGTLELTPTAVVSMCADVTCENNAALVYFTSHSGNQGWIKIKLTDAEGNLLGQSGLLRPGEYVESVHLDSAPKENGLIVAKILIYEPDTYLSLGSASAQISLTVK